MKKGYYACRYGGQTRICWIRTFDLGQVCRDLFGCVAEPMELCFLGTQIKLLRSTKKLNSILEVKENWFLVPEEYLTFKIDLIYRSKRLTRKEV